MTKFSFYRNLRIVNLPNGTKFVGTHIDIVKFNEFFC